uniref:hypothetical protein n=1 Tax=Aliivibrio fischeri TaxID=668 RepID=UPI00155D9C13|nr:hypothetical protein [Aliivibrio fischeri]
MLYFYLKTVIHTKGSARNEPKNWLLGWVVIMSCTYVYYVSKQSIYIKYINEYLKEKRASLRSKIPPISIIQFYAPKKYLSKMETGPNSTHLT